MIKRIAQLFQNVSLQIKAPIREDKHIYMLIEARDLALFKIALPRFANITFRLSKHDKAVMIVYLCLIRILISNLTLILLTKLKNICDIVGLFICPRSKVLKIEFVLM